ncbi:hypothetical protein ID866_7751 [Astraeus odoratus]|nr:hypothetical protein ID866_7751 [Astraeus odoratus]
MYVPLLSQSRSPPERRKGGGTGGHGASGGGGKGSGGSKGSSSSGKGSSSTGGGKISLSGATSYFNSASAYGYGGGKAITIPSGQPFEGRSAGGGTRDQVFGTKYVDIYFPAVLLAELASSARTYGSGYPGIDGRGVSGRGFPFWFWPLIWGSNAGAAQTYLNGSEVRQLAFNCPSLISLSGIGGSVQYGDSFNTTRVGGALMEATFISNNSNPNTTFYLVSDNATVTSLISSISSNCSTYLSTSSSTSPTSFNGSSPSSPRPEQAIQYYRASSVVLALDGYNNSATYSDNSSIPDSPLPSNIDVKLLDCLNQTIGLAAPLVDGALPTLFGTPSIPGLMLLGLLIHWISSCV